MRFKKSVFLEGELCSFDQVQFQLREQRCGILSWVESDVFFLFLRKLAVMTCILLTS